MLFAVRMSPMKMSNPQRRKYLYLHYTFPHMQKTRSLVDSSQTSDSTYYFQSEAGDNSP